MAKKKKLKVSVFIINTKELHFSNLTLPCEALKLMHEVIFSKN